MKFVKKSEKLNGKINGCQNYAKKIIAKMY